jgi:hypothetical protein
MSKQVSIYDCVHNCYRQVPLENAKKLVEKFGEIKEAVEVAENTKTVEEQLEEQKSNTKE